MKDPVVWYTINAQLDGLDTGSDSPHDRMKFLVYQRRMLLSVIRDKALILATINAEGAQKAFKEYMDLQIPTDPQIKKLQDFRFEKTLDEIEKTGPIPLSSFSFGIPLGQGLPDIEE